MKLSEAFPSRYLKADDLNDADRVVTITSAKQELVGQGKDAGLKLVLGFKETPRLLVVNKTNGTTVAKLHGSDTDDWIGKRITLFPTTVEFSGEQMAAIRVRPNAPLPPRPQQQPAPGPEVLEENVFTEEEVPFI